MTMALRHSMHVEQTKMGDQPLAHQMLTHMEPAAGMGAALSLGHVFGPDLPENSPRLPSQSVQLMVLDWLVL